MKSGNLPQILIVDDNPDDLNLLAMLLRRANYIVLEAETGENCLKLLSQITPDLIMLDVVMPGMDGFETCRQLKTIPQVAEVPVIFLTSLDQPEEKVRGFGVGGADFVVKPLERQELFARIENQLALQRSKAEVVELNTQLEELMQKRMAELHTESLWRRQYEEEVTKLLETVRYQGEQLSMLMQSYMKHSQGDQSNVVNALSELPQAYFNLLREHLNCAQFHAEAMQDKTTGTLITEHLSAGAELLNSIDTQLRKVAINYNGTVNGAGGHHDVLEKLSTREQEILRLIADGSSNSEIAEMLSLAEPTVRVYRSRIMGKLQLSDVTSLIKFAIKHNLTALN